MSKFGVIYRLILVPFVIGVLVFASSVATTYAASLTSTSIRFNRMKTGLGTTFRLTFAVPVGNTGTEASVKIGFTDNFTVATSGLTADSSSCGATALPGTLTATGNNTSGSKSVTVGGVTNLSASTSYCVDIDRTTTNDPITNPAAGSYIVSIATQDSGSTTIDNSLIAARVINDDQISVTAVVPPTFNFVIDSNSTSFATNLDPSAIKETTPHTVTITSNSVAGWVAWAKDSNTGLTSAAASKTIASTTPGSAATITVGTEGYVLGVDKTDAAGGGTVTVTPAYVGTAGNGNGSGLDTSYRQIGSADGTANGDVLTLRGKATIEALTPTGVDYGDTWTVIGAGSY